MGDMVLTTPHSEGARWRMPGVEWGARVAQKAAQRAESIVRNRQVVTLKPMQAPRGRALVSYLIEPFLVDWDRLPLNDPMRWHSNAWECREIAATFLERGFVVDVINFTNTHHRPNVSYDVMMDTRHNLERLAGASSKNGVRIFHVDVANTVFQNLAENQRLLDLQARRGVTLKTRRAEPPNRGMEVATCATVLGNKFTLDSFAYAGKPMYPIPLSSPLDTPTPTQKNFDAVRRNFIWIGSSGLVRKGLDVVLEAFAQMPEFNLYVCGAIGRMGAKSRTGAQLAIEEDFEREYYRELYQTPNIHTVGWMDTASAKFAAIAEKCVGMAYASSCEGQCGGVITCMHWGLIPVISYESGVDVDDHGFLFDSCSVEDIKKKLQEVAALSTDELRDRAHKTWTYARTHHTRDNFGKVYRETVDRILA